MKAIIVVAALVLAPLAASAQQQQKTEIQVHNYRSEDITMQFAYAFREYKWTLMKRDVPVESDLTYRFPVNIPGCEKLHAWGIADGVLSISNGKGVLCQQRLSLCDKTTAVMDVRNTQCLWRRAP